MSARGLGVPGLLEDGMMDGWLDYREYNLNANAISTTYNLSNYLLKYSKRDNGGFNAGPKPPKLAARRSHLGLSYPSASTSIKLLNRFKPRFYSTNSMKSADSLKFNGLWV